jgi:hypothetical protein
MECEICYEDQPINRHYVTNCCRQNLCNTCNVLVISRRCPFCRNDDYYIVLQNNSKKLITSQTNYDDCNDIIWIFVFGIAFIVTEVILVPPEFRITLEHSRRDAKFIIAFIILIVESSVLVSLRDILILKSSKKWSDILTLLRESIFIIFAGFISCCIVAMHENARLQKI